MFVIECIKEDGQYFVSYDCHMVASEAEKRFPKYPRFVQAFNHVVVFDSDTSALEYYNEHKVLFEAFDSVIVYRIDFKSMMVLQGQSNLE